MTKFGSDATFALTKDLQILRDDTYGPFNRFPGFTFSTVTMSRGSMHDGEMHPDGDEIVFVVSGSIEVVLELDESCTVHVGKGEGIVIPKGVWHKVRVLELGQLITISPGPGFQHRPKEIERHVRQGS